LDLRLQSIGNAGSLEQPHGVSVEIHGSRLFGDLGRALTHHHPETATTQQQSQRSADWTGANYCHVEHSR
jgi:hypothetical protein